MRSRASALLLAPLMACALAPAAAHAAAPAEPANIGPYTAVVDSPSEAATLQEIGYDMTESGYDSSDSSSQELELFLSPKEAATLEARGVETSAVAIEAPTAKNKALGDSPNPFFNVWRSYSEDGGIEDEMRATAAANPEVMKLEQIGTTMLGKPILVIKMTADARNVPDGTRPALLFSAINHAREWVAAEQGRRLPVWFAEHKNDPKIKEILGKTELWFMPIQNIDGYDFTFTCGLGADQVPCDYRNPPAGKSANRFWRKTIRDNNNNGIYGDSQDGVDPNRNYPAKRAIDEEGASNNIASGTYRGPYPLSEAGNLAVDRLQRRVKFYGNINYHTDGQLLLTPVSYTTDYAPPDSTIFAAMTGTDGDSAVFPYQPQRSSDLYESNGDTIDNGYLNYGIIGWTPEMDTCETGGDVVGCPGFSFPDVEAKMKAVFDKNLAFALNTANSLLELDRPKNYDNDPNHYQIKPTEDIQVNRFDVSYGGEQQVEAIVRKTLGPSDIRVSLTTPGNIPTKRNVTKVWPMETAPAGERYGEVPGYYFERRRATIGEFPAVGNPAQPATYSPPRYAAAGDLLNVRVLAGGLQKEFNYRVESSTIDASKKRVLIVAAEDYKGVSPNVKPGYDTAPRYLNTYKTALEGLGYEVSTFDVDNPPANNGTPNGVVYPPIKYPTNLGVLSHFDAVVYESGDDFIPQDITITDPKRMSSATTQVGSNEMAPWFHHAMLELRDYANEGGKLIVAGRNVHQAPTGTTNTQGNTSLSATGPYTWTPDKLFGFYYPDNNGGDDDLPGTAFLRSRPTSNDTWQNYLGVSGRQGGVGTTTSYAGAPIAPAAGGLFAGMSNITVDSAPGNDPNQNADGSPAPASKTPIRLRNWAGASGAVNEPLRAERIEADFSTTPAQNATGGAIISTRDSVTFGFGLEQVDPDARSELLKRSLDYLVPKTADTVAPTIVGYKWPLANSTATPADPIEVDVTAYDDRGDLKQVNLYADGALVGSVPVFPFQFRYTPPKSKVGQTVKLTAEAVDKAGNKSTRDLLVNILDTDDLVLSPVPVNKPTLSGSPLVGQTMSCLNGGFLNSPRSYSYAWLRSGTPITGAIGSSYTLTNDDLGRTIACRMSATNSAGTADATSEALYVSAPAPAPSAIAETKVVTVTVPAPAAPKATLAFTASCKLAKSRKAITCAVSSNTAATFSGSIRLQGHKTASASKTGKKKVTLTVRSTKALKKGTKVVLKLKSGKTTKQLTVKAG
jgi:zinc carboxypeptidase/Big-like domain-containing protein